MKDINSDNDYIINIMDYDGNAEPVFFYVNDEENWYLHNYDEQTDQYKKTDATLASVINYGLETREVEPTVNNPDSSRSALLIQVLCQGKDNKTQSIFMWDLPGSERFKCSEGLSWILKLDDSYSESLKYGDREENKNEIKFNEFACLQSEKNQDNINDENIYQNYNESITKEDVDSKKMNEIHLFEDDIDEKILLKYLKIDSYKGQKKEKNDDGLKSKCNKLAEYIKECGKKLKFKKDINFMQDVITVENYFDKLDNILLQSKKNLLIWRNIRNVSFLIRKMVEEKKKKGGGVKDQATFDSFQKDKKFSHLFDNIFNEKGSKTLKSTDDTISKEILTDKFKKDLFIETDIKATDFLSLDKNILNYLTMCFAYQFLLKELQLNESITVGKAQMSQYTHFEKFKKLFLNKENIEFIREKYKQYKQDYKDVLCEIHRMKKLNYNCNLRITEGYMINQTLTQLKSDMKKIVLKSIISKNKGILPLALDRDIYTYCKNAYIETEYFDELNSDIQNESFTGQIVKIMQSKDHFDTQLDTNMNFCIFTVINVTDNNVLENRPNPPYINISNLIYNLDIENKGMKDIPDYNLLRKYIFTIMTRIKDYKFYKDMIQDKTRSFVGETILNDLYQKYLQMEKGSLNIPNDEIVSLAKTLIEIISVNNEATLIGSLQSTEEIANITFNKTVCSYNKDLDDVFKSFPKMPLDKFNYMKSQSFQPTNPDEIIQKLSVSK